MAKQIWKGGNMVYPVPAVMVSVGNKAGQTNIFTVAWTGNICTNPPMVYISVRPERYSYEFIEETGEFVLNLTTEKLVRATDFCGVRSGRDIDKWTECGLTKEKAAKLEYAPLIKESPVNIECRVKQSLDLGSHRMYIADVLSVDADEAYLDEKGSFRLDKADLIAYSHGDYMSLGEKLGSFGYSVRKPAAKDKTSEASKKTSKKTVKKKEPANLKKVQAKRKTQK